MITHKMGSKFSFLVLHQAGREAQAVRIFHIKETISAVPFYFFTLISFGRWGLGKGKDTDSNLLSAGSFPKSTHRSSGGPESSG